MKIKFEYATLLSIQELYDNDDYIEDVDYNTHYWLRSPTYLYNPEKTGTAYQGYVLTSQGSTLGQGVDNPYLEYVRPVLKLEKSYINNIKVGTKILIFNKSYTVLNDGLIIDNFYINNNETCCFNQNKNDGNDYSKSFVKGIVDNWFNSNFQDEVEVEMKGE